VLARLSAEFRHRWARAGYPTLVQHILGNLSQAPGVRPGVLQDIARSVRAEHEREQAGRPAEAAPLYAELMCDPCPPDVEADELEQFVHRQYAFREECARAVFECCRLTEDLPGLIRAYQELCEVLRALAADAGVALGSEGNRARRGDTGTV
jgi:hypothetical protein